MYGIDDGHRNVRDEVMAEYGRLYRENKQACEQILGELIDSDLEWLRNYCWRAVQK